MATNLAIDPGTRYQIDKYVDPAKGIKEVAPILMEDPNVAAAVVAYENSKALLMRLLDDKTVEDDS